MTTASDAWPGSRNPGADRSEWTRHDLSRRKRGMSDVAVARDLGEDGDVGFIGTRGNDARSDGVHWLEQVRTDSPQASFVAARKIDSEEMPPP